MPECSKAYVKIYLLSFLVLYINSLLRINITPRSKEEQMDSPESRIDMHVHYLPRAYREALLMNPGANPDKFPTPDWNPEAHLEFMEAMHIATSMISVSSPHLSFADGASVREIARQANEEGADLAIKYPGRFGLLASLPLPDVTGSITEIEYSLDELHADGFTLPTNARGVYLGDPKLDPVFEILNKRRAVVVIHPTTPGLIPPNVAERAPIPMMEFFFDTTRTLTNLILNRTLKRFPDVRIVVPHAGAFLPLLADRLFAFTNYMPQDGDVPDVYAELRSLYYDVAGFCVPRQLSVLLGITGPENLLYGSDYPYTPQFGCEILADLLEKTDLLTDAHRKDIYRGNALRLFPHLAN
jgi:6-methylsalicylate decarboxylase